MADAVYKGEIPEDGIVSRLSEIEAYRTTGILRFKDGDKSGEVALVQGQISADQPESSDGSDAVETLLELRSGTFELIQHLPPLPVSKGDATSREGSLEVHVPADLMNYCERAGLTGVIEFRDDDKVAEIAYAKGELCGIRLDGLDDLHQVFGWEDGTFRIEVRGEAPDFEAELTEPPPPDRSVPAPAADADATGKHFLKVVEVTLAEIVKEREERRPATRTSPPLPPMSGPNKHPTLRPPDVVAKPPRKERKDQTVRVIYLGNRDEKPVAPTPTPSPERAKKKPSTGSRAAKKPSVSERKDPVNEGPIQLPTAAWVGITLLVVIAALVLLANLPPIE